MSDQFPTAPTPPAAPKAYSIREALAFGWTATKSNLGQIVIGGLLILAVLVAVTVAQVVAQHGATAAGNSGNTGRESLLNLIGLLIGVAGSVFELVIGVGIARAALGALDGVPVHASALLSWKRVWPVALASFVITVGTIVGLFLLIVPGLIFAFLAYYAQYFIIDRDQGPWQAVTSSIRMVGAHPGAAFGFMITCCGVVLLGILAFGVGLIVAIPVVAFATAYTYRALSATDQPA